MSVATYCRSCGLDKLFLSDGVCDECRWEAEVSVSSSTTPITPSKTIQASEIVARNVDWLWPDRVPLGMTSVFGRFPGVGKSTILYDLAARTSREGRAVLIATAEDHLAAVVRPRLEAAGANLELVHVVNADVTLPDGISTIRDLVTGLDAALVILDPLVAFISETVNSHRDHHVRRVLAPLADLAEETRTAIVVVIHTNKGSDSEPLMRISGSIGFTGAARLVLLAADDPQDEGRRILAVVKSNLAEVPPPLAYRLVGVDADGGVSTSKVEWLGEAPEVDVRELLAQRNPEERGATEDAMEFLRAVGLLEAARPAKDVLREAKIEGHQERTVQRARKVLGIPTWRDGFGRTGVWYWGPRPNEAPIDASHRRQSTLGALAPLQLPAETDGHGPIDAKTETFRKGLRTILEADGARCDVCGAPATTAEPRSDGNILWMCDDPAHRPCQRGSEATCVRCKRYGSDHQGDHVEHWATP